MFRLIKMIKDKGRWRIFKLKLIDARLYFVSIFVGLLTGLVAVPYHYLLQFFFNLRHDFFDSHPKWYWYIPLFLLMWGILVFVSWLVKKMPLITGGGIPQTRGVINGRVDYKHPFLELVAKFVGGILALSTGLSLGREGPSVQIGSYVGYLVSKWGRVLSGERKQLLSAGAGAGLAAAFAAPLASSLLVIESIERFDAPKTAITTLLAGVVAGGVASWIFPINPYFHIDAIVPEMTFWGQVKLFLLLAAVVSVFGKFFSVTTLQVKRIYPAIKHPEYVKMLYLLFIAFLISMAEFNLTGLLRQVVIDDQGVFTAVAEVFTHRGAGVRSDVLHGGGFGSRGGNDDGVFHGAAFFELANDVGDRGGLLADGNVHAGKVLALLVDDRVDGDGGLTTLAVANDEFALAAADRDHGVNGLQARLNRLGNGLAVDNAGSNLFDDVEEFRVDRTPAVDRLTESVHNAADKFRTNGNGKNLAGRLDQVAFGNVFVGTENNGTDGVTFEVEGEAIRIAGEFQHFALHHVAKTVNTADTVGHRHDGALGTKICGNAEAFDTLLQQIADFTGIELHLTAPNVFKR